MIREKLSLGLRSFPIEESEIAQYANTDETFIQEYLSVLEAIYNDQTKLESFIIMYQDFHSGQNAFLSFDLFYRCFWKLFLDPIILDNAFDLSRIFIDDEYFRFLRLQKEYWSSVYDGTQFWKGSPLPPDEIDLTTVDPLIVAAIPFQQILDLYDELYLNHLNPTSYDEAKATLIDEVGTRDYYLKDGFHRFFLATRQNLSMMKAYVIPYYNATIPIPYIKYQALYDQAKVLSGVTP